MNNKSDAQLVKRDFELSRGYLKTLIREYLEWKSKFNRLSDLAKSGDRWEEYVRIDLNLEWVLGLAQEAIADKLHHSQTLIGAQFLKLVNMGAFQQSFPELDELADPALLEIIQAVLAET